MSNETNLIHIDLENIDVGDTGYIKEVDTVNNGDSLRVTLSDGSTVSAGDLIPSPAKNLTDIQMNEDGHLVFQMDGDASYDAGKLEIELTNEGEFPSGLGVLSKEGFLKELKSSSTSSVEEGADSVLLSMESTGSASPFTNTINTRSTASYDYTVLADTNATGSTTLELEGGELYISRGVQLSSGLNKLAVTFLFQNVKMFAFILRNPTDDTIVHSKEYSIRPGSEALGELFESEIALTEDTLVDIVVRFDSPNVKYLEANISQARASYLLTLCTVNVVNIKIDETKLVNYTPPEGANYLQYEKVNEYLDSLPSSYKKREMSLLHSQGSVLSVHEYGDKVVATHDECRNISIYDTITGELEDVYIPVEGKMRVSYLLVSKDELWFGTSTGSKLYKFNLVTRELEVTIYTYSTSFTEILWDFTNDKPYAIVSGRNTYVYDDDANGTYRNLGTVSTEENFRYPGSYSRSIYSGAIDVRMGYIDAAGTTRTYTYNDEKISADYSDFVACSDNENVYALSYIQYTPDKHAFSGYSSAAFMKEGFIARNVTNRSGINSGAAFFNPLGTNLTISDNPEIYNLSYELITLNEDNFKINGFTFYNSGPSSPSPSKMEIWTSTEVPLLSKDMKLVEPDKIYHYSDYTADHLLDDSHSGIHGDANTRLVSAGCPEITVELNDSAIIKSVGVSSFPGLIGSRTPEFFSIELSNDGENWVDSAIQYEDIPIVTSPESGVHIFDSPVTTSALRVKFPWQGTRFVHHFHPLVMIDGKIEILPIDIESTESNNIVNTADGIVVKAESIVNTNQAYGITRMFSKNDIDETSISNAIYTYFGSQGEVPKTITYSFPENREIVGYVCNGRGVNDLVDGVVEHSTDGENWIELASLSTEATISAPVYNFGVMSLLDRKKTPIDDLLILKLVNPSQAKYIRLFMSPNVHTSVSVDRVRINPLSKEDYLVQEVDVSSDTNFFDIDLPEMTEARQVKVKITERNENSGMVLRDFKFKLENDNFFRLTKLNRETNERTSIDFNLSFESEELRKNFLNAVPTIRYQRIGIVNDELRWILDFTGRFAKVENGVVKRPIETGFSLKDKFQFKGRDLYLRNDTDYLEKLTADGVYTIEDLGKSRLEYTLSGNSIIDKPGIVPATGEHFIVNRTMENVLKYDYINDKVSALNAPTDGFNSYTGLIPLDDGTAVLLPYRDVELHAILPVGTLAKRSKIVNMNDGSEGFSALPDTRHLSSELVNIRFPINEINSGTIDVLLPRFDESRSYSDLKYFKKEKDVTGEIEYVFEFRTPVTFNAFDSGYGYTSTSAVTYCDTIKLYTSDDGEVWSLVAAHDMVNKGSVSKDPRETFTKVTSKYVRYVVDYPADGRDQVRCPWIILVTDEEDYTTTDYDRVVQYTEGHSYEDLGQASENSTNKYYDWIRLDEFRYLILPYGTINVTPAIVFDTRTKKMVAHMLDIDSSGRVDAKVKLPDGSYLLILTSKVAYILNTDLTIKNTAFNIEEYLVNSVLSKDATHFVANYNNGYRPFTINVVNSMNSSESYSGNTHGQGELRALVANQGEVLVFTSDVDSYYTTSLDKLESIEVPYDVPLPTRATYAERLPDGRILLTLNNSSGRSTILAVLESDELTGEILEGYNEYKRIGE